MKRLLSLLVLIVVSVFSFVGCEKDRNSTNISDLYKEMTNVGIVNDEKKSRLFNDENLANTISIYYPLNVQSVINMETPNNNMDRRYKALYYQQQILNLIFNFYENNNETFYKILPTVDTNTKDLNNLYEKLESLKKELEDFNTEYTIFIETTSKGVSDIAEGKINIYTYKINILIEKSFDFIYEFINVYEKYCVNKVENEITVDHLKFCVDKSNVDIAYIVYQENFKSFNYIIGSNGITDLSPLIACSDSKYVLIDKLNKYKLSERISETLASKQGTYEEDKKLVNEYFYFNDLFQQSLMSYKTIYTSINFRDFNTYRLGLGNGMTYENYLNSLKYSDLTSIKMLESFVEDRFIILIDKLLQLA